MKREIEQKIIEYYHLSKSLCSGRGERLLYVQRYILIDFPHLEKGKKLWNLIDKLTNPFIIERI